MPGPILCASPDGEDPFSRSYGVSLPNSLTMNLSSALVYSTRPPVSVYGTGAPRLVLSGFSREHVPPPLSARPGARGTVGARHTARICLGRVYLPPFNAPFRRRAGASLLRLRVAARASNGMLTVSSIGLAARLSLRARLTLNRLALFRKPWSYGEGVSRPLYRYLYLHLLLRALQRGSAPAFNARAMLPYRRGYTAAPHVFGTGLHARLLSTRDRSTGELLRTL